VNPVESYARAVVAGDVPAGKYHRLSCARHLSDLDRQDTPGFPYRFEWEPAARALRFFGLLKHYQGEWAGQLFTPSPCQVFRLGSVFGWRHVPTGRRRFTTAYIDQPRKSGKTFEAGMVLDYVTFFEGEPGAQGYCIATKEKQARLVFRDAKKVITTSGLSKRIKVGAANMHDPITESKAEPLGSDSDTTDGLSPHVVVVDELHAMKTRDLIDVMESATGARRNPLFYYITTHGKNMVSPWGEMLTYAHQILDGTLEDDPSTLSYFVFIAHADEGDDPFAESTWVKANPHWGISVNPEDMRKQAAKAKQMPSALAEFKQKRLNVLPVENSQWLSMEGWKAGQRATPSELETALRGRKCWIGVDLASKIDLCAMVAMFPPTEDDPSIRLLRWVWTPDETLAERSHRDRAPYRVWVEQGHLLTSPGTSIDHSAVRAKVVALREVYQIQAVGFDPWHAHQLQRDLVDIDGFPATQVIEVPQSYAGLSAASLHLEAEVLAGRVNAGGCPLMAWTFANAVVQRDGKDNIQPIKKHSRGRIDPVVASCIALSAWLRNPEPAASVYLTRGVRVLGD